MPNVTFGPAIQRHVPVAARDVRAATVAQALAAVFVEQPALRGYILDDQGGLRRHVAIFVDGAMIRDRIRLGDPLHADSRVYVVQALSGG